MTVAMSAPTSFMSLEREYYMSPEIFTTELERIFTGQWFLFAHISDIAALGSIRVQRIASESDGQLHGLFQRLPAPRVSGLRPGREKEATGVAPTASGGARSTTCRGTRRS